MVLEKQLHFLFVDEVGVVLDLGHAQQLSYFNVIVSPTITVLFLDLVELVTFLSTSAVAHSVLFSWSDALVSLLTG